MSDFLQPGHLARRVVLRRVLSAGAGAVVAAVGMRVSRADDGTKVVIGNFAFGPPMLRVKAGTTVTWVNHDDIPHSIVCPPLSVHSHPMDTDESFSFTFAKAGVYNYLCGLHPFMHGQVVVSA
ncbi:MAG TPA: cupredoxin family copper-binding protein [Acetobacteraceae bacterium]|nr:cupredoxin family copper-binding protein [Acetobacteraceae bacterium]